MEKDEEYNRFQVKYERVYCSRLTFVKKMRCQTTVGRSSTIVKAVFHMRTDTPYVNEAHKGGRQI